MTKDEAVKHYGTQQALADALGISQGSVSLWKEYPPDLQQIKLQAITGGALRAEPYCFEPKRKASAQEAA